MKNYLKGHKLLILLSVVFIVCVAILEALQAMLFKLIVDTAVGNTNVTLNQLILYSTAFLLGLLIIDTASKSANEKLKCSVMKDYKNAIINKYLSMTHQSKLTTSKMLSIMTNDLNEIENNYLSSFINISKDVLLFLVSIYLLFNINVYLTLSIFAVILVPIILPQLLNKKTQKLKGEYLENIEQYTERIKELCQGFEVIKSFNIENKVLNSFKATNKKTAHSKFSSNALISFQGAVSTVSGFLMFFVNVLIATYLVLKGDITIGSLVASVQLMNYIVNPIVSISTYTTKIKSVKKVIESIDVSILQFVDDESRDKKEIMAFNQHITLSDLSYSYDKEKNVLSNLNYTFEKGKKYAILGESGCGKTTLLKILMNQISDYSGTICIDNTSLNKIDPTDYYNKVSTIQQNTFMFNDTLKNNICLYNEFDEDRIDYAIKHSGLTKTVNKHGNTMEFLIGEGNIALSGGELKRVAIARALIKDVELLLSDEATSALDNITSYEIEETLVNLDSTLIAITHKTDKSILSKYDEILVLREGHIVESGDFETLINNNSFFYQLYVSSQV